MSDIVDAPFAPAPVWDKPASTGNRNNTAWARVFARATDGALVGLPITFALGFSIGIVCMVLDQPQVLAAMTRGGVIGYLVNLGLAIIATGFAETILIAAFRGTPGKALLGIKVARPDGRRLSLWRSASRYLMCLVVGRGLSLPLVSAGTAVIAYNRFIDKGTTIWDDALDLNVTRHSVGWWRWAIAILCLVATMLFTLAERLASKEF